MRKFGLALIAVVGCTAGESPLLGEQQQAAGEGFHVQLAGTAADAAYVDATHSFHIQVGKSRDTGFPTDTFLFYELDEVFNTVPSRVVSDFGFGAVPPSDIEVTPSNGHVHTSTSVPGFTFQRCVYSEGTTTCSDGIAGTIDMTWHDNGLSSQFNSGTSSIRTQSFMTRFDGTSWSVNATATGDVVGTHIETAYGNLSDTRQQQTGITFTRNL
jgi:hypothetical protein